MMNLESINWTKPVTRQEFLARLPQELRTIYCRAKFINPFAALSETCLHHYGVRINEFLGWHSQDNSKCFKTFVWSKFYHREFTLTLTHVDFGIRYTIGLEPWYCRNSDYNIMVEYYKNMHGIGFNEKDFKIVIE